MTKMEDRELNPNVVLFPMTRTMAWRPVEATCLRAAGAGNAALKKAIMYLRLKYRNAPAELVEAELELVHEYMQKRIHLYRIQAGLVQIEKRDDAAGVVNFEPPPAA